MPHAGRPVPTRGEFIRKVVCEVTTISSVISSALTFHKCLKLDELCFNIIILQDFLFQCHGHAVIGLLSLLRGLLIPTCPINSMGGSLLINVAIRVWDFFGFFCRSDGLGRESEAEHVHVFLMQITARVIFHPLSRKPCGVR